MQKAKRTHFHRVSNGFSLLVTVVTVKNFTHKYSIFHITLFSWYFTENKTLCSFDLPTQNTTCNYMIVCMYHISLSFRTDTWCVYTYLSFNASTWWNKVVFSLYNWALDTMASLYFCSNSCNRSCIQNTFQRIFTLKSININRIYN